jgi:hypothetical protein
MPAIQLMDVRSQYSADLATRLKGSAEVQCVDIPPRTNFREEREIYVFPLTLLIMDDPPLTFDKCDRLLHDLPPWLWLCALVIFVLKHNPRLQGWQVIYFN